MDINFFYPNYALNKKFNALDLAKFFTFFCQLFSVGTIIIDEVHNLQGRHSSDREELINFLITLVNLTGVPVIFCGTMDALDLIMKRMKLLRRSAGVGNPVWEPYEKDDPQWRILVETFWKYQYTLHETKLDQDLFDSIYELTQGITDLLVSLLVVSQRRAIDAGVEKLTKGVLYSAADDNFMLLSQYLSYRKYNNLMGLSQFKDAYLPDEYQYRSTQAEEELEITGYTKHYTENQEGRTTEDLAREEIAEILNLNNLDGG